MTQAPPLISEDEKDILQEIMNIAFGNATADLAEVIDIYVVLNVPDIKVVEESKLPEFIHDIIRTSNETSIVEQKFWGDFSGSGVLIFPNRTGRDLITILDDSPPEDDIESRPIQPLANEILMEVGNILIGACVGKISELLNTFVTYSPPNVRVEANSDFRYISEAFEADQAAIVMKTLFQFEAKNVNGFMLLLTNNDSLDWLKQALNDFLETYDE